MQVGIGQQFVADDDRLVVLAGGEVNRGQASVVGVLRVAIDGRFEFGDTGVPVFAGYGEHAKAIVSLGDGVLLVLSPLVVGDLGIRLGSGFHKLDGVGEILGGRGELV